MKWSSPPLGSYGVLYLCMTAAGAFEHAFPTRHFALTYCSLTATGIAILAFEWRRERRKRAATAGMC